VVARVVRRACERAQRRRLHPVHFAAFFGTPLLLSYGAAAGVRNDHGQTPPDLARAEGHDDIAAELEARLAR